MSAPSCRPFTYEDSSIDAQMRTDPCSIQFHPEDPPTALPGLGQLRSAMKDNAVSTIPLPQSAAAAPAAPDPSRPVYPTDCHFKAFTYFCLLTRLAWTFQETFHGAGRFSTAIIKAANRDWKQYFHHHASKSGDNVAQEFHGMRMLTSEGAQRLAQTVEDNTRANRGHSIHALLASQEEAGGSLSS